VKISSDIVLAAKSPVFARPYLNYEIWHAIYEKAYGIFMLSQRSLLPFHGKPGYENIENYPRPDIPSFSGGNPLESLEHLTNLSWTLGTTYFNTRDIMGQSFTKISNAITSRDDPNPAIKFTYGITRYPMVAWTFKNATDANSGYSTDLITYSNEIIVANHSYSILGTVIDKTNSSNPINYIVLRNPYGTLWGADPGDFPAGNLYTGTWSPVSGFSKTLSVNDGIFALKADRFERYFIAFGWVQ
jgi:hypothetical protein